MSTASSPGKDTSVHQLCKNVLKVKLVLAASVYLPAYPANTEAVEIRLQEKVSGMVQTFLVRLNTSCRRKLHAHSLVFFLFLTGQFGRSLPDPFPGIHVRVCGCDLRQQTQSFHYYR